jgi:hypothetical protein
MIDMAYSHDCLRSNAVVWLAVAGLLTTACGDDQPADTGAGTSDGETTTNTTGDGDDPGDGDGDPGDGDGAPGDGDPDPDLEGALGCAGVFNPDQILDLYLDPAAWQTVLGDLSFSIYVQAQFPARVLTKIQLVAP